LPFLVMGKMQVSTNVTYLAYWGKHQNYERR
jgi:hypothetical protein